MKFETSRNCKAVHSNVYVSALSICSSLKAKRSTKKERKNESLFAMATTRTIARVIRDNSVACNSDPSSVVNTTTNTNDPNNSKIKHLICCVAQIPAKEGIFRSLDSACKLIYTDIYELRS
ncbi:hypothetical protein PIROE2DRAFT_7712 [Piromyces sp. E2]|nr:hypothetical protein PIROE2DRAFT_7712 [Piromyces sp. E2]|eukprot:OUM65330.1 hypothetical protein PIROE2DRAFT_7712 [Piromyces sp. E2]